MGYIDTSSGTIEAPDNERVSAVQIRVVLLCALLLAFDGYDIGSIAFAVPSLAKEWGLAPAAFTQAIVAGSVGMLLGALISGGLGDRFGRKPVFIGCVATFGVFSLASAVCTNVTELATVRFLTGLGLGGGVPIAIALASDYSPRRWQATLVSAMSVGVPVGIVLGGNFAALLIPNFGWKSVFILGGLVPVLLVPVLMLWLPESLRFLQARARALAGGATKLPNPLPELFRNGFSPITILLWICFATNFLSTYMTLLWLPAILNGAGGTPSQAVFGATLFSLAGIVGAFLLVKPITRFGSEKTLCLSLFAGAVATFVAGSMVPSYQTLLVLIFCMGFGVSGSQMGMNALAGSAYPTEIRSTGAGWALGVGRLGNVLGPLMGGMLLQRGFQAQSIFLVASVPVLIAAISMFALGIWRRRLMRATVRAGTPAVQGGL